MPSSFAFRGNPSGSDALFAFGTLCLPEVFAAVVGRCPPGTPATLAGYRAVLVHGACYPGLIPAPAAAQVQGVLYRHIDDADWRLLDQFEGEGYQRRDVTVVTPHDGVCTAQVYHTTPRYRHTLSEVPWDLARFRAAHLSAFLATCREVSDGRRASVADPGDGA